MSGMRAFTPGELASLRGTQEGAMMDTCQVLAFAAGAQNAYGEPGAPTYTAGSAIACGYNPKGGKERVWVDKTTSAKTVITSDATLRLPTGTALDLRDRIKITHLKGEALASPMVFEVVAPIRQGPSGLQVDLRIYQT